MELTLYDDYGKTVWAFGMWLDLLNFTDLSMNSRRGIYLKPEVKY